MKSQGQEKDKKRKGETKMINMTGEKTERIVVHKGERDENGGIFNYCNNMVDSSKWSLDWKKVTCSKCYVKKNLLERGE